MKSDVRLPFLIAHVALAIVVAVGLVGVVGVRTVVAKVGDAVVILVGRGRHNFGRWRGRRRRRLPIAEQIPRALVAAALRIEPLGVHDRNAGRDLRHARAARGCPRGR